MNRKITTIAIIVAFVGGMFFAGTPVEAKKGGGGTIIDEVLAAIAELDVRVTALENQSPALKKEFHEVSLDLSSYPLSTLFQIEIECPNGGVVEGNSPVNAVREGSAYYDGIGFQQILPDQFLPDGHGVRFTLEKNLNEASLDVGMFCISS